MVYKINIFFVIYWLNINDKQYKLNQYSDYIMATL